MKLTTREDIEAPIAYVYERASDFVGFERAALRRGIQVKRKDPAGGLGIGSEWDATVPYRGKPRQIEARLDSTDAPNGYTVRGSSGGVDGLTLVELVSLSPRRTRLTVSIDLAAKTLAARLLLQSLKLARGTLTRRFETRVATYARQIEESHRKGG